MATSQKVSYQVVSEERSLEEKFSLPYLPKRTLQWVGGVSGGMLADITDRIQSLIIEDATEPINLIVTSHGGPTGIGMSFYDSMRSVFKPILNTVGSGDVDSSGIIIFLTGEKRFLTPNTTLLLHLAGRTFDTPKRLTTPEMESIIKEDKLKDFQYASVIADRSNGRLNVQTVLDLMANNTVLTPSDAVELGIAHAILQD
ncbi:ATP-dependent Clp protease proteolytic subunit [Patescibacteria group bacterium]|nr:ATP-dependent Clp protease proteolytic subunit [Patescibacteria group bacterium]